MTTPDSAVPYDRTKLVSVLVYHQRVSPSDCACGPVRLGSSFADHVADVYEQAIEIESRRAASESSRGDA